MAGTRFRYHNSGFKKSLTRQCRSQSFWIGKSIKQDMSLPWVPSIWFGVILVRGLEGNISLGEICEGSLGLPLNVQLYKKKRSTNVKSERRIFSCHNKQCYGWNTKHVLFLLSFYEWVIVCVCKTASLRFTHSFYFSTVMLMVTCLNNFIFKTQAKSTKTFILLHHN